jgi:predicted nucleic-acid-binding protein
VRITADTNILVRAIVDDDVTQAALAREALLNAERIVITLSALCELARVMNRRYRLPRTDVAEAIQRLIDDPRVEVPLQAVDAGLHMLLLGGDFADGVIAHEGRAQGGTTFLSFDRRAVRILGEAGYVTRLLG